MTDAGWVSWMPTIRQGPTIAKTVRYARYVWLGEAFVAQVDIVVSRYGVGESNADLFVTKPMPTKPWNCYVGTGILYDVSRDEHYMLNVADESDEQWRLDVDAKVQPVLNPGDVLQFQVGPPLPPPSGET